MSLVLEFVRDKSQKESAPYLKSGRNFSERYA